MILASYIFFSLLIVYALIMAWFAIGFVKTNYFTATYTSSTSLTIIICARNEEKTIGRCLATILKQDYDLSKIQLILINDASTDTTVFQAETILKNSKINYTKSILV